MAIGVSLDHTNKIYSREIYSLLDWLADVGGIHDGLRIIGSMFMSLYSFAFGSPLDAFLLKSLFKRKVQPNSTPIKSPSGNVDKVSNNSSQSAFEKIKSRTAFISLICSRWRKKKERQLYERGMTRVEKELEIDSVLRTLM